MKHTPRDDFENAQPLPDFRHYLSENKPLSVRFTEAILDSKFVFRSIMGAGLAIAGVAVADIKYGSHNFTKTLTCDVSYIDTERNQLVKVTHNSSQKTMLTVFHGCAQVLESIDGEARTFVDYTSNSGVVIPGLNIIDGSPMSLGLKGAQLSEGNANDRLAAAKEENQSNRRWLVENYMRIAGQTYALENIQFQYHQAGYTISDKMEYTVSDIGYWFEEKGREASNIMGRLMGAPNQSPN
jgi:hypothetical protein